MKITNILRLLKTGVLTLLCTGFSTSGKAQSAAPEPQSSRANKPFTTGEIPQLYRFEKLTEREAKMDTRKFRRWQESLARMEDGTAFREGVSPAEQAKSIARHKATFRRYKDNRSRYYLTPYTNGIPEKGTFLGLDADTVTTDCDCILTGDTLNIKMGIWVFGGFAINLQLTGNRFRSIYWEDTHEQKVYRNHPGDTVLADNIQVENAASALVLERKPEYKLGENLLGYFTFTTAGYYKLHYGEGPATGPFDKLKLSGSLHFKCVVSESPEGK